MKDQLVDHDEITHCECSGSHAVGGKIHHGSKRRREDEVLPRIEKGQGCGHLDGGLLIVSEGLIVPTYLVLLVVEVLDRFEVDQGVHRHGGTLIIGSIGFLPEPSAPRCRDDGEAGICDHGHGRYGGKFGSILISQDATDHGYFQRGREDVEDHGGEQEADPLGATINGPSESAGLALQVEIQIQTQQVLEDVAGDSSNRFLRNAGKDCVTKLLQDGSTNSGSTI